MKMRGLFNMILGQRNVAEGLKKHIVIFRDRNEVSVDVRLPAVHTMGPRVATMGKWSLSMMDDIMLRSRPIAFGSTMPGEQMQ